RTGGREDGWPGERVVGRTGGRENGWPGERVAGRTGGREDGWPGGRVVGRTGGRENAARDARRRVLRFSRPLVLPSSGSPVLRLPFRPTASVSA
ncbi:MAG: hypothetical protein P8Z74_20950, partial [Acidobacteriota bacterium]